MKSDILIEDEAEVTEEFFEKCLERTNKINRIIASIEDWTKVLRNPDSVIAHLRAILTVLDLAMQGDEDATEALLNEEKQAQKANKKKIPINFSEPCEA